MPDAPGTCHLVGCPGKGQHPPHGIARAAIGVPSEETWRRTSQPQEHCLGHPTVTAVCDGDVRAACSISGAAAWASCNLDELTPADMARLVDQHKAGCTNRSPR